MIMLRSLWLACPNALKTVFTDIPTCYWESNGSGDWWLKLPTGADGIAVNDSFLLGGDEPYAVTFRRLRRTSNYQKVRRGYKVTLKQKAAFFYLIQSLSQDAGGQFQVVTYLDFIRPETADFLTARSQSPTPASPYTQRTGLITSLQPAGAMLGTKGSELWFSGGFTFDISEEAVR